MKQARDVEDQLRDELRSQRRAGFHEWSRAGAEGGMRALYRWVREGPRGLQSTGVFVKEGRLYAGQAALLEASEQAWWPLWRQPEAPWWPRVEKPKAAQGWEVIGIEAEDLMRVVQGMARSKAPGHDGWGVGRLRQWPLAVWTCVVGLFEAVETTGRWPEALRGGVICLLPKAGVQATTVRPLEARPVVLLPLLYRLWAYRRGREIGQWLRQNGMDGLPDPTTSAEAYGTLLAAELEQATVMNEPMLAVCVDLSKAYDSVRLGLLEFLLCGSGLPKEVWRPVLSMATARRGIKVTQAVGD